MPGSGYTKYFLGPELNSDNNLIDGIIIVFWKYLETFHTGGVRHLHYPFLKTVPVEIHCILPAWLRFGQSVWIVWLVFWWSFNNYAKLTAFVGTQGFVYTSVAAWFTFWENNIFILAILVVIYNINVITVMTMRSSNSILKQQ